MRVEGTLVPDVASMSLEEKVGQLVMARYPDIPTLERTLAAGQAGAFYFGMRNKNTADVIETLNRLQRIAKYPQIVAFPSAVTTLGTGLIRGNLMRVGATRSREIAYRFGYIETIEARALGFTLLGMPVLDVNTNPANPIINTRALSDNPALVTELGIELLRGIIDGRGMTCAMHFPGHGATNRDSHIDVPTDARSAKTIHAVDLAPYHGAIGQKLLNGICTNHVHYPAFDGETPVPATVSRRIITGLLREELGYDGVIMSDSLTMRAMKTRYGIEESAVLAVASGHDLILQDYESDPVITHCAVVNAVRSGRIPEAQVNASVARILRLKEWLGLFENRFADADKAAGCLAAPEHKAFAMRLARESVTALENRAIPLRVSAGEHCVVITNGSGTVRNIDMDIAFEPTFERFNRAVRKRLPTAEIMTLNPDMSSDWIEAAWRAAQAASVVIFGVFTKALCYHEDSINLRPAHSELVRKVASLGRQFVIVNFGNPYVMKNLPKADAAILTYDGECAESIEAAVEALFGEIPTRGKLPITISTDYPFGYGL